MHACSCTPGSWPLSTTTPRKQSDGCKKLPQSSRCYCRVSARCLRRGDKKLLSNKRSNPNMSTQFTILKQIVAALLLTLFPFALPTNVLASSHMDAPLIILDPAANTTDVYAFVDQDGNQKSLVLALGVYPHEEP